MWFESTAGAIIKSHDQKEPWMVKGNRVIANGYAGRISHVVECIIGASVNASCDSIKMVMKLYVFMAGGGNAMPFNPRDVQLK